MGLGLVQQNVLNLHGKMATAGVMKIGGVAVEGAMSGKVLSEVTKKGIETAFGDCAEKLCGKKATYLRFDKEARRKFEQVAMQTVVERKKKVDELAGILQGVLKESGIENELHIKTEIFAPYMNTARVYIEINSKTSGFYARFTMDQYINKTFLFVNPGITDSKKADVGLEGATNDNMKQMMLELTDMLANFKNPDVWKEPKAWANKVADWLNGPFNQKDTFSQAVWRVNYVFKNFMSGQENGEQFIVYAPIDFISRVKVNVKSGTKDMGGNIISSGKEVVVLELERENGRTFGKTALGDTKPVQSGFDSENIKDAVLKTFSFLSEYAASHAKISV